MYVVRDVLKSNISVIDRNYLSNLFQQPKHQRIKSADLTTEIRVTAGLTARYRKTITFPVHDRVSMQL